VDFWRQKLIRSYEGGFLEAKVRLQKINIHGQSRLPEAKALLILMITNKSLHLQYAMEDNYSDFMKKTFLAQGW
jgi:hypothetical protein